VRSEPSTSRFKNYAFISYSRKDEPEVRWLHQSVEGFRIPTGLPARTDGSKHPRYLRPLFRDKTDLEVQPRSFIEQIERELAASRFLIVVCSPNAARSRPDGKHYVDWEVRRFIQAHGVPYAREHILPVILAGDPGCGDPERECLPPALLELGPGFREHNFPLLKDLPRDRRGQAEAREQCLIDIVAFLLGVEKATIRDRHLRVQRERLRKFVAAAAIVTLIFVALVAWALSERNTADARQQSADAAQREAAQAKAEQSRRQAEAKEKDAALQRLELERRAERENAAEAKAQAEKARQEADRRAAARGALSIESNASGVSWEILSAPDSPKDGAQPAHPATGAVPCRLPSLRLGEYLVEFTRTGWKPLRAKITVNADETTIARQDYISGDMSLSSNATDVTWTIVSAPTLFNPTTRAGIVPQTLHDIPVGNYTVEFQRRGTSLAHLVATIAAGEITLVTYQPPQGILEISSNDSEARWEIISAPDGLRPTDKSGRVPVEVTNLPVGDYIIEFQRAGWPSFRKSVRIDSAKRAKAVGEFVGGVVELDSTPAGAEVFDARGGSLGRTPVILRNVRPGDFVVTVRKPGYEEATASGTVTPPETLRLKRQLKIAGANSDAQNQSEILLPP
jgi:hypothetical protein